MSERHGYKKRDQGVPAENQETGRTVRVLPETLKDEPGKFRPVQDDEVGDPRWRGKSKPSRPARRPDRPDVPRESPPAPVHPPDPKRPSKQTPPVNPVTVVPEMKEPEPSPPRRWKRLKKYEPTMTASARSVLNRFISANQRKP